MYILKDFPTDGNKFKHKISDRRYDLMREVDQQKYRVYTAEDEDIENGHPYPAHETWED